MILFIFHFPSSRLHFHPRPLFSLSNSSLFHFWFYISIFLNSLYGGHFYLHPQLLCFMTLMDNLFHPYVMVRNEVHYHTMQNAETWGIAKQIRNRTLQNMYLLFRYFSFSELC